MVILKDVSVLGDVQNLVKVWQKTRENVRSGNLQFFSLEEIRQ